ncbi:hypothetical protein ANO14919_130940 [Xylariales sp. No.14919]|nr:hypothetical protein ANO14919_130940 [Xylariales sp. No.14919]
MFKPGYVREKTRKSSRRSIAVTASAFSVGILFSSFTLSIVPFIFLCWCSCQCLTPSKISEIPSPQTAINARRESDAQSHICRDGTEEHTTVGISASTSVDVIGIIGMGLGILGTGVSIMGVDGICVASSVA